MNFDFQLFIDGEWVPASDGARKDVSNPANGEVLGSIAAATAADIDRAVAAASAGFDVWRKTSPWERSSKIRKVAELIRERAEDIAYVMSSETGKPKHEAMGETMASAEQFEWYSEETKRIYGQTIEARTDDVRMQVIYQPVGVVAAFSAWNFPALLPARKMAAALAAGCSVIVKPASETPGSCAALVQACQDADIPPGVVNFLTGSSSFISEKVIQAPAVRKVSLTGSVPIGKEILHLCADGIKKVSMELGGHAPVLVFEDADPVLAARTCAGTKFRNCGQVCISPSRFFVHESIYEEFSKEFAAVAKALKIGPGLEDGTQVGPMANQRGVDGAQVLVNDALEKGAQLLAGGSKPEGFTKGFYFQPTVLGNVPDNARIMSEEPFGPVAPLTPFKDYDEVMARANALPFGLAGYIFTNSLRLANLASEDLEVGMVGINEMLLASAEIPFGGIKESGYGREGGSLGIKDYLEPKYIKTKF